MRRACPLSLGRTCCSHICSYYFSVWIATHSIFYLKTKHLVQLMCCAPLTKANRWNRLRASVHMECVKVPLSMLSSGPLPGFKAGSVYADGIACLIRDCPCGLRCLCVVVVCGAVVCGHLCPFGAIDLLVNSGGYGGVNGVGLPELFHRMPIEEVAVACCSTRAMPSNLDSARW